jgi:hypothetical protein
MVLASQFHIARENSPVEVQQAFVHQKQAQLARHIARPATIALWPSLLYLVANFESLKGRIIMTIRGSNHSSEVDCMTKKWQR